jgi:hypothetical protein
MVRVITDGVPSTTAGCIVRKEVTPDLFQAFGIGQEFLVLYVGEPTIQSELRRRE